MSYSFNAPLPQSFFYPATCPAEDTSKGLEYRPTNIQDNVSPLFDEDLCRSPDIPSLDIGWESHYWPSPTPLNPEHAFSSECVSHDLCPAVGPDMQLCHDSACAEYSSDLGDYNSTSSHLSSSTAISQPSGIELSTPPSTSDESYYSSDASGTDADAYGETDSEYGDGSTLTSDEDDDDDDDYYPSSTSRSSNRAGLSTSRSRASSGSHSARRVSHSTRTSRNQRISPYPSSHQTNSSPSRAYGTYPSPPYVCTPIRTEQAPPGTPRSLPQSAIAASKCPLCPYRLRKSRPSDLRRHYNGHFAEEDRKYVCCGVRIDRVGKYSTVAAVKGDTYEHNGEVRVGRCWQVFSRLDALKRHLHQSPECICDVYSAKHYAKKR